MTDPAQFSLSQLAEIVVKHLDIHEGRYELAVNFNVGVGPIASPATRAPIPGVVIGIEGFALMKVQEGASGPNVVDAAVVNPPVRRRLTKRSTTK